MKSLFVIMCRDVPCSLKYFSNNCIDISGNFLENMTYFDSYELAADRLQLITDQIDDLKFAYDYLSSYTRPAVNDFYIAEVSFNRYMPPAGNTMSDKFGSAEYKVSDKVIFVRSSIIYIGEIETIHAFGVDDLPRNNKYTYDILPTARIENSKFTQTVTGDHPPIPIDTEIVFDDILEECIIGLA